ncbi:MAG: cellulose biosynthesis protein BcsS [Hyphomicrobiaceae bacterium]
MQKIACATAITLALAASIGLAPSAKAGGDEGYAPGYGLTYPIAIVSGGDFAKNAAEGYTGLFFAFNRDLDRDGFVFRALGTRGVYDYRDSGTTFDGDYWQGDVMLGYQWVRPGYEFGVYVGADFQNYDLSPDDPFNKLNGDEAGFKVAADLESNDGRPSPIYYNLQGSYSTAFDTYYALGRLGYKFGRITLGPEVWALGDVSGDAQRVGGFLMFDVPLRPTTPGRLTLSAGYQFTDDNNNNGRFSNSGFGEEGAYGTIHFQIALGRPAPAPAPLK